MNHAVKEKIIDNVLCIEVESGLPKSVGTITKSMDFGKPPISIGDTVYQGKFWLQSKDALFNYSFDNAPRDRSYLIQQSKEMMPIELAGKTFKVLGIEVEKHLEVETEYLGTTMSDHLPIPQVRLHSKDKWFWKYSLEEIK